MQYVNYSQINTLINLSICSFAHEQVRCLYIRSALLSYFLILFWFINLIFLNIRTALYSKYSRVNSYKLPHQYRDQSEWYSKKPSSSPLILTIRSWKSGGRKDKKCRSGKVMELQLGALWSNCNV